MIREIATFTKVALTRGDYLRNYWKSKRALTNWTVAMTVAIAALCMFAPQLLADWYQQSILEIAPMNEWLWGGWFLLVLAMALFQFMETATYINGFFDRRYRQSSYLTNGGGGDDIFAEFMAEGDREKYIAPGIAEERLIQGVYEALYSAVMEIVLLRATIFLPAAIVSAFAPELMLPAIVLTGTIGCCIYTVVYARQGTAASIFYSVISVPLFATFLLNGLFAAFCVQLAMLLSMKVSSYGTKKFYWQRDKNKK